MKAQELIAKLKESIENYGEDCEVRLLDSDCFGSDRYGIGVGLVAATNKTFEFYDNCTSPSSGDATIKSNMTTLISDYFGVDSPLW